MPMKLFILIILLLSSCNPLREKYSCTKRVSLPVNRQKVGVTVYDFIPSKRISNTIFKACAALHLDSLTIGLYKYYDPGYHNPYVAAAKLGYASDREYVLFINTFHEYNIETICHEVIHIWQTETKRLVYVGGPYVIWKDSLCNINDIPYFERGWEIEARGLGKHLSKIIKNNKNVDIYNFKHISNN